MRFRRRYHYNYKSPKACPVKVQFQIYGIFWEIDFCTKFWIMLQRIIAKYYKVFIIEFKVLVIIRKAIFEYNRNNLIGLRNLALQKLL